MTEKQHELILIDRKELRLTGILSVDTCNDRLIVCQTVLGTIFIAGNKLKVLYLNPENSEVAVSGSINSLEYRNRESRKRSALLQRLRKWGE